MSKYHLPAECSVVLQINEEDSDAAAEHRVFHTERVWSW